MAGAIVIGREDESVNPVRKKATLFSVSPAIVSRFEFAKRTRLG
jgi:hypothetical protein